MNRPCWIEEYKNKEHKWCSASTWLILDCAYSGSSNSETHSVHDLRTTFIVLVLRNPHFLKRGQRGQDAASDPDRVLPLRRGHHFHLNRCRSQSGHFLV